MIGRRADDPQLKGLRWGAVVGAGGAVGIASGQARGQTLTDTWFLRKKGRFSLNATWINTVVTIVSPSHEALQLVGKMDHLQKVCAHTQSIENFLSNSLGEDFHQKYKDATGAVQKSIELQRVMHLFQHVVYMSIGSDDIANSITTETILLNKSLKIEYDVLVAHRMAQGNDAKKYFTMKLDQYVRKQPKKDLKAQMMGSLNDLAGRKDGGAPDPVFSEIEVGDLHQDTKQI